MSTLENATSMLDLAGADGGDLARRFSMQGRVIVGSVFALLLVAGIGGWASTFKLSGAVVSAGTVLVYGEVKSVQHVDGGVVRELDVADGDEVARGQVLLRLDDVQIRAERDILVAQLGELTGRQARLIAERDLETSISYPGDFVTRFENADAIMRGENQLFTGNLRNRKSQRDQLSAQISQLYDEIDGLLAQQAAQTTELVLSKEERERIASLHEDGLIEGSRLNALDRDIARMEGRSGEIESSLARSRGKIAEINLQILAIDDAARNDAQRELRTVEAQISELVERLRAVEDRLARTEVRSPVAGTINELAIHTVGGVIVPAQTLMTVVPADAPLAIEFRVGPRDIDQISLGQSARLRFTSFNRRTTPEIAARVTRISAAATKDPQTGEHYYLAQVEIVGDLAPLGGRPLVPGMPVEVFVETEEQLAVAYFAKPFTDQITRAFREE